MTYDDWKTATPPEYERDRAPAAQTQQSTEEPAHRCASHECWACGVCQVCEKEHKPFCDAVKHSMYEEDITW